MAVYLYRKYFQQRLQKGVVREKCIHEMMAADTGFETRSNEPPFPTRGHFPIQDETSEIELQYRKQASNTETKDTSKLTTPCPFCREEQQAAKRYRWRIVIGLVLPFTCASLDTTIIASAASFIASDFHQISQLNWIISAYTLTSLAFIPAWGQYADVFGRYIPLQAATALMVIGSAICSGSPVTAFPVLLLGRAIQGIGCSGILILTRVILADKVSLAENAKNNTTFVFVGGLGYGIGPVIGGYLTQVSWKWCFIINIPIGLVGAVISHFVLRKVLLGPQTISRSDGVPEETQTFTTRLATIDYAGQFLFLFGMGLFILALTWAGANYPWSDVKVIAPLVIGVLLMVALLFWEYALLPGHWAAAKYPLQQAMIPLKLVWTRNVGLLLYINLVAGMAMYAVYYFVDFYFALVLEYDSGKAGVNLLYYIPGLAVGTYLAIFTLNIFPRQTFWPLLLGTIVEPLGITLLAVGMQKDHLPFIYGMLGLTGVGTGIRLMPGNSPFHSFYSSPTPRRKFIFLKTNYGTNNLFKGTLHTIAYNPTRIPQMVSLMSLALSLGGTLATTIMLNIFNNRLSLSVPSLPSFSINSYDSITSLPPSSQALIRDKARNAIVLAFYAITAFLWLGVVAMMGVGNAKLTKGKGGVVQDVVKGSYVGWVLRRGWRSEQF
ncbi:hypothetical protein B7494_g7754 [Chlorociboria aeruginascens]|nr:hypothetical protein B7494_g7754 [Chlorociboria aeruginascens]